jgi:DNA-binding Lrp family transcriptional regulator
MAEELGISEYAIKNRIPELVKLGLINVIRKGVPCKNYYSTNDEKILDILVNQLDDTKSTNKRVDYEVTQLDHTKSTIQLGRNQLTSEYEIGSTITNNTNQEYINKNTTKNTGATEEVILSNQLDLLTEYIDDNNIPAAKHLIEGLLDDYESFDKIISIVYKEDTQSITNWKNYYTNTLQYIN